MSSAAGPPAQGAPGQPSTRAGTQGQGALEAAQAGVFYAASLPERALRAMVAAAGGLVRESARAAVPDAMKRSKLYELTVRKMLGFLLKDVGGMEKLPGEALPPSGAALAPAARAPGAPASHPPGSQPATAPLETAPPEAAPLKAAPLKAAPLEEGTVFSPLDPPQGTAGTEGTPVPQGSEFMVKKALGNAIDIAGLATLHVSPLWVLAVFSDVVLGARTYLQALTEDLKQRGVIERDAQFEGVDGLLQALQKVSGTMADHLDTPPVTLKELERMVDTLRTESGRVDLTSVLPESEIQRLWTAIQEAARLEGRSPFEVSSALAMMVYTQLSRVGQGAVGSVKVGLDLLQDNVIEYYLDSLAEMNRKGYYQSILDVSQPYMEGLAHLFEPSRESYTEMVLKGKPFRAAWSKLRRWCRRRAHEEGSSGPAQSPAPAESSRPVQSTGRLSPSARPRKE